MTDVRLRHSLVSRLLAMSVLIALCSVAVTTWLVVQTTTSAIQDEEGQALSDDARIYEALVGYAATHQTWAAVGPTLAELSADTGREITLASNDRQLVATSTANPSPLAERASARVDALHVDPNLLPDSSGGIDARVSTPYELDAKDRAEQWAAGAKVLGCAGVADPGGPEVSATQDLAGYVTIERSDLMDGRVKPDPMALSKCNLDSLRKAPPQQVAALAELSRSVNRCLRNRGLQAATLTTSLIGADGHVVATPTALFEGRADRRQRKCLESSQHAQLRTYVAPAVQLFVRNPDSGHRARFDLSEQNLARIFGVALAVLLATVVATIVLGSRLVRPLRELTAEVQHPSHQRAHVPVRRHDEIGVLATALNTMAERRERAESQRSAMVRDVAHELRTPLSNIRSWLEAIEDGLADPAADPALTPALLNEARQLQEIIDDLQDLADADTAGLRYTPETVSVDDLVRQVITIHRSGAEARGVRLQAVTSDTTWLQADPVRLRQALANLVANAVRYSPAGATVLVEASNHDGTEVRISVTDVGLGIAADDLSHVFDRFWRVDPSRSRDSGGSGLGLAIVKQIAEAHGGQITATSEPGQGSSFTLHLPAHPSPRHDYRPRTSDK